MSTPRFASVEQPRGTRAAMLTVLFVAVFVGAVVANEAGALAALPLDGFKQAGLSALEAAVGAFSSTTTKSVTPTAALGSPIDAAGSVAAPARATNAPRGAAPATPAQIAASSGNPTAPPSTARPAGVPSATPRQVSQTFTVGPTTPPALRPSVPASVPSAIATVTPAVAAPTVQIRNPLTEQTHGGAIQIRAVATNVTTVAYRVDSAGETPMSYDETTKQWRADLNTTTLANGLHDVTVIGRGPSGSVEDRAWRVQVNNAAPTAAPTAAPAVAPVIIAPVAANRGSKVYGVNVNGAEFGEQKLPGTLNTDYMYPNERSRQAYLAGKGQTLVRLPFRWERIQRVPLGPLYAADVAGIRSVLDAAQSAGQRVILDLHNYGRYYGAPMTRADAGRFADVWAKIAAEFRGHPALYGYELMNEPHDLPEGSDAWAFLSQVATDAIRTQDTSVWVLVPGYGWQTAGYWPQNNPTLNVSDPTGRLLYAAHQYFDADYTGMYARSYDVDKTYPTIGVDRVRPFLNWLASRNARGIMTEYGIPDTDARWLNVLDAFMTTLDADPRVLGGTYWAAGTWWGTYPLSVEPRGGVDRPQMVILERHRTRN